MIMVQIAWPTPAKSSDCVVVDMHEDTKLGIVMSKVWRSFVQTNGSTVANTSKQSSLCNKQALPEYKLHNIYEQDWPTCQTLQVEELSSLLHIPD